MLLLRIHSKGRLVRQYDAAGLFQRAHYKGHQEQREGVRASPHEEVPEQKGNFLQ